MSKTLKLVLIGCGVFICLVVSVVGIGIFAWYESDLPKRLTESLIEPVVPDVEHPKTFDCEAFSLQYPGNWTVESKDGLFKVAAPQGQGMITFIVYGGALVDPKNELKAFQSEFRDPGYTMGEMKPVNQWGPHRGYGEKGLATFEKFPTKTEMNFSLFAPDGQSKNTSSLILMELSAKASQSTIEPGLDMIRTSFKSKLNPQ